MSHTKEAASLNDERRLEVEQQQRRPPRSPDRRKNGNSDTPSKPPVSPMLFYGAPDGFRFTDWGLAFDPRQVQSANYEGEFVHKKSALVIGWASKGGYDLFLPQKISVDHESKSVRANWEIPFEKANVSWLRHNCYLEKNCKFVFSADSSVGIKPKPPVPVIVKPIGAKGLAVCSVTIHSEVKKPRRKAPELVGYDLHIINVNEKTTMAWSVKFTYCYVVGDNVAKFSLITSVVVD